MKLKQHIFHISLIYSLMSLYYFTICCIKEPISIGNLMINGLQREILGQVFQEKPIWFAKLLFSFSWNWIKKQNTKDIFLVVKTRTKNIKTERTKTSQPIIYFGFSVLCVSLSLSYYIFFINLHIHLPKVRRICNH